MIFSTQLALQTLSLFFLFRKNWILEFSTIVFMFPLNSSAELSGIFWLVSRTLVLLLFATSCNDNVPLFASSYLLTISASGMKQTFIWSSNYVSKTNKFMLPSTKLLLAFICALSKIEQSLLWATISGLPKVLLRVFKATFYYNLWLLRYVLPVYVVRSIV